MPELIFKGKEYVYNHHLTVPYRPLIPHKDKSIGTADLSGNLIIHGDNLHALKALMPRYAGKIDLIFIDPPYNTGNENWAYNDNVNSPLMKEWLSSNPVNAEDMLRHDKWLCMMWPRLVLLRELLAENGSIWITLDDNEMHRARSVLDELFGVENFIAQIVVQTNKRGQTYKQLAKTHEYLICYGRSPNTELAEFSTDGENLDQNDRRGKFSARELRNRNPQFGKHNRPNLYYPIYVDPNNVDEYGHHIAAIDRTDSHEEILPKNSEGNDSCWRWGQDKVRKALSAGSTDILFARKTREGQWRVFEKYRKESVKAKTIWAESKHISEQGTTELGRLGLEKLFQFPKPVGLLDDILALASNSDSLILDSFAGSGTTAHAVLRANVEDSGNRQFILLECENYADKLTAERVRRVIAGYAFIGTQREQLLAEKINLSTLQKSRSLLQEVETIKAREGFAEGDLADQGTQIKKRFDKISVKINDGELCVEGEKKISERVEGLGGEFTYCTLGEPLDAERLLSGESLPDYANLGAWLFHTATGGTLDPTHIDESIFYLGEARDRHVWLIYRPDMEFLKSTAAALTLSFARELPTKRAGKPHLVFAAAKFMSNKQLLEHGVEFASLPFGLYREA